MRASREGIVYLIGFVSCIPAANWLIGNVGTVCLEHGPCLLPVAPDVMAPSGVLVAGLAFVLRDLVQRHLGKLWALAAIGLGGAMSGFVAASSLAIASIVAFLLSELVDFSAYTAIQKRAFVAAVLVSSFIGLLVDSVAFLYLAFGNLDHLLGQIVGKTWMVVVMIPFILWIRAREKRTEAADL